MLRFLLNWFKNKFFKKKVVEVLIENNIPKATTPPKPFKSCNSWLSNKIPKLLELCKEKNKDIVLMYNSNIVITIEVSKHDNEINASLINDVINDIIDKNNIKLKCKRFDIDYDTKGNITVNLKV